MTGLPRHTGGDGGQALAIPAAGALIWYGTARVPELPGSPRLDATGSSGYPLLALPLLGAALATGTTSRRPQPRHVPRSPWRRRHRRRDPRDAVHGGAAPLRRPPRRTRRAAAHPRLQCPRRRPGARRPPRRAVAVAGRRAPSSACPTRTSSAGGSAALVHPETPVPGSPPDAGAGAPPDPCEVRLRDGFGRWRDTEWRLSGPDPARPAGRWWSTYGTSASAGSWSARCAGPRTPTG